ncbi:MAG: MtrB/PioB family decaheme-associated outer membrane protein [Halieaceae bacterium]|jgi:MtrB/PioB family decaheme-associated outer membrane protein|nr:MtrB/PioB family decaheme-associated outer membrane protein [Halieaceae bacterium]
MKSMNRFPCHLGAASSLVLAACGALAQETGQYTPLALQNRPPLKTAWQADQPLIAQLGLGYTSDDNYMFGEYNGLNDDGVTVIGNLQWRDFSGGDSFWQGYLSNLGLDTREGELTWGKAGRFSLSAGFDSQLQVSSDEGRTPFTGGTRLELPDDWVSGLTTSDWTNLNQSLHGFDQELKRERVYLKADTRLNRNWTVDTNLSYEEKTGSNDIGAGIYIDGSSADAVLLNQPIDYRTTEFDLGLAYSDSKLSLEGRLFYSDFDNQDDVLTWQNPYSSYGPNVRYPAGIGGLGLAPDNDQLGGRVIGQYVFSPTIRLQVDGSYAVASQNQDFLDYSVNPALVVTEPLPKNNYDGEVDNSTFNTRLLLNPLPKLSAEVFYKYRNRDYDADRNGYQYIRGDGGNQPGTALTVYNTNHDYRSETPGFEVSYRLPLRSKLSFEYEYEKVTRENAPVEETEQDRYTLGYRIQPWSNFTTRLEVSYADRAADTYEWAQNYYALLDTELINATPDTERYISHPGLMKYYMANRDQWQTSADFNFLPTDRWNLSLNLQWIDNDYGASELGLTGDEWYRSHISASYVASETLSASLYGGYDYYNADQSSRAFRGGPEKNAFVIYPPLPQASDPNRNWTGEMEDTSVTLGANIQWQLSTDIELSFDYSYVDTQAEQNLGTRATSNLVASDLPTVNTTLHNVRLSGIWHMQENLFLQLDYQFYDYKSDDWAWQGVRPDTIGKVLTFGQGNPNEQINYVGASVIYHWE